jgi:cell division protein FtsQ
MLNRINWKSVFNYFAWIVGLGGIVTLMSFIEVKKHEVNCTNIKILIPGADNFIEREEIDAILKQSEGQLIGRKLEDINLHAIEEKIKSNPYIALATVYADMDGVIHIEISQRQPLLRVINMGGQDYYIDRDGLKMPVSPNFTANVVVANGNIMEHFTGRVDTLITKMASDLYKTARFLKKDSLWDAQIEQIFVNEKNDIILIPRVGNQRIILGDADSLETKMTNLLTFYKKAMPQVGWDTYKTINIKYTNQIVCEKSKPDSVNTANGFVVAKPFTPVTEKKVMDSIIRAEIAAELKNKSNPEVDIVTPVVTPEKKAAASVKKVTEPVKKAASFPAVRIIPAPAAKQVLKKNTGPIIKKSVKTEIRKSAPAVVKKTTAAVTKKNSVPAVKVAEKKWVKPVEKKVTTASIKKPEAKKAEVKKPETKKAEIKKTDNKKPATAKAVAAEKNTRKNK